MQVWSAHALVPPLPAGHRFPMDKYAALHARVAARPDLFVVQAAPAATDGDLLRVHDPDYLARVATGTLQPVEARVLGFPWSTALVTRARHSVGATLAACRVALAEGVSANLAGGTHHAHRGHPGAFCLYNDCAVAARWLQATAGIGPVLIVDCDVHQGDGTAAIFAGDPTVYTLSVHGERNYPRRKYASDLDVGLPDGTGDADYLGALDAALATAFAASEPEFVLYLAGADPYAQDRWGRLALTKPGLAARDGRVLEACRVRDVPVAIAMGGGYAPRLEDIVDIHYATLQVAARVARAVA